MKNSRKILGLDLGTTSIGWAFIKENKDKPEESRIIRSGVKIIPLTTDEEKEFTQGQRQTKNAQRRLKRSMRRNLQRFKLRRRKLIAILKRYGMMPDKDLLTKPDRLEIYGLRAKAVSEEITLQELGRVLYHLNQKRGYSSNRRADNEEETTSEQKSKPSNSSDDGTEQTKKAKEGYVEGIERRSEELVKKGWTVGQKLYEELKENPHYRVKSSDTNKTVYFRELYIDEFDRIWETQSKYHKILTDDLKRLIKDETIYYQRRLKSAKHLVSKCRFEPNLRVCPKSSPFHQIRRMWQDINHLSVIGGVDKNGVIVDGKLDADGREALFWALWMNSVPAAKKSKKGTETAKKKTKTGLTEKDIRDILGYKKGKVNFPKNEDGEIVNTLRGFTTLVRLRKALTESGVQDAENYLQFDYNKYIAPADPEQKNDPIAEPLYALWHHLYSFDGSTQKLVASLMKKYDFTEAQAKALVKVNFENDYSSLSAKATRKILPYLAEGKVYSEACEAAGYRHSDYLTKDEKWTSVDSLKLLKRNSLRNPAVEKILNHLINLVNAILADDELGRPHEIHVELARELKQNIKKRKKITEENSKREAERKKIVAILQEKQGILRPSRDDITRYQLWQEFGMRDIYDPLGGTISLSEAFSGNYDIDHIIPQSRLFDDGFTNKVLTRRNLNLKKGNMTAREFMESRSDAEFEAYKRLVDENKNISEAKANRLAWKNEDIPDNFIERQLRETQYITKEALKILKMICNPQDVISTSGSVTDFLRDQWGMSSILKRLNIERYSKLGRVEEHTADEHGNKYYVIKDWSKRDDHRHHAVDAIVIAATSRSAIQAINTLNQRYESYPHLKDESPYFGPFWTEDRRREAVTIDKTGEKEDLTPTEKKLLAKFRNDAEASVASILVSFKTGKRVAVKNDNHYEFKGDKRKQKTFTPRGFFHKETIYGKVMMRERLEVSKNMRVADLERVSDPRMVDLIKERLAKYGNDPKKAFKDLGKDPIWLDEEKKIPLIDAPLAQAQMREVYVLREKLGPDFKHVDKIVDVNVRNLVYERLNGASPKEALKDLDNKPILLNKDKGIAVKRVRVLVRNESLVPLHKDDQTGKLKDFVATSNNHHVAIYRKPDGTLEEEIVTFWDAFNRKRDGQPIINRNPADGREFLFSMQVNELFVFNLDPEKIDITDPKNYAEVSKNLYRVQKLSSMNYMFRHHLATTIADDITSENVQSFGRLVALMPIKISVDATNRISLLLKH